MVSFLKKFNPTNYFLANRHMPMSHCVSIVITAGSSPTKCEVPIKISLGCIHKNTHFKTKMCCGFFSHWHVKGHKNTQFV